MSSRRDDDLPGKALLESFFATHDVPYETRRAAASIIRRGLEAYRSGSKENLNVPAGQDVIEGEAVNKGGEQRKAGIRSFFRILRIRRQHFRSDPRLGGTD